MKKDLQWLIDFYEKIPEDKWTTEKYHYKDKYCALGHLGFGDYNRPSFVHEVNQIVELTYLVVANDNVGKIYQQDNPKARVLYFLNKLKQERI